MKAEKLTLLDLVEVRFEKALAARKKENERSRAKLKELNATLAGMKDRRFRSEEKIAEATREYRALLAEAKALAAEEIKKANVTEADVEAGSVGIRDFMTADKKKKEIEAARLAEEHITAARVPIRGLFLKLYEIDKLIGEMQEGISILTPRGAELFYTQIEAFKRDLESAGVRGIVPQIARTLKQEALNDYAMAKKNAALYHTKQWSVKSFEDAELLVLDQILQGAHLNSFHEYLESIRGLSFSTLTVGYSPCDLPGHSAGEFWTVSMRGQAAART